MSERTGLKKRDEFCGFEIFESDDVPEGELWLVPNDDRPLTPEEYRARSVRIVGATDKR